MRAGLFVRLTVSAGLLVSGAAAAADAPDYSALKQTLESRFPNTKIISIGAAPIPGLVEIFTGDSIAYATPNGDYLVLGSVMDTRTRLNVTSKSLDVHNSVDFSSLPVGKAIKVVKGNGKRQIAVFSDPDCPFCQKFEQELESVTDVTVYTYLFPLENVHPDARAKAEKIWCSPDRAKAWTQWMHEKKLADKPATCAGIPLRDLQAVAAKLRINSTPTIFLSDGKRISGTLTAKELEAQFARLSAPVAAAR
jgi:thiol:disulfide interchange protein DsbC